MMPDTNACPDPFSLPMNNLADAQALVRAIEALLSQRGLSLRPPPPVPEYLLWTGLQRLCLARILRSADLLAGSGPATRALRAIDPQGRPHRSIALPRRVDQPGKQCP
jgi:hypothetical protein